MATFTDRGMVLPDPPTILVENLLDDPFLRDSVWSQNGSTGTFTDVLVGGPNGNGYFEYDMLTANTSSPMSVELNDETGVDAIPCVPGETINLSCWAFRDIVDGAQSQRFNVTWYNAAGGTISTDNTANVTTVQNEFVRVNMNVVAPALAVFFKPRFIWSGTYPIGSTLRVADGQVTKGAGVKTFTTVPITDDDGDIVNVAQLNANLDRASLLGVGGRPILSGERPAYGTPDGRRGNILFETDTNNVLIRRNSTSDSNGNADPDWRVVIPGQWYDFEGNNIWSGWLSGDNNLREARYMLLGRLCFVHVAATIGTGGDIFGTIALSSALPVLPDSNVEDAEFGYSYGGDELATGPWPLGGATARMGSDIWYGRVIKNGNNVGIRTIPATNPETGSLWGATIPANWAVGNSVSFDFVYTTS